MRIAKLRGALGLGIKKNPREKLKKQLTKKTRKNPREKQKKQLREKQELDANLFIN